MTQNLTVAVIGGGIGGLSAALSLLRAGLDVHVFEQSRMVHEVGAGRLPRLAPTGARNSRRRRRDVPVGAVRPSTPCAVVGGQSDAPGDACHAMLAFMAQGAAQAIEDGATLATVLSAADFDGMPEALRTYEAARRPRVAKAHGLSNANKTRLHLPDGPAQRARDAEMAAGNTDFSFPAIDWLLRFDARQPLDQCAGRS